MKWSKEAEKTMARVPFFIRKMVRKKVEAYALEQGATVVLDDHIEACRKRFMKSMYKELKGYSVETCLGAKGCTNRTLSQTDIADRIEDFLKGQGLKEFLEKRLGRPLKVHNEFRVSISFCPNSCSRPQIVDIGLVGAAVPGLTEEECINCGACKNACQEGAIVLEENGSYAEAERQEVQVDEKRCLFCGHCARVCPSGTLAVKQEGFRILVGGKLGRHPQLGFELPGIFGPDAALKKVKEITGFYKERCKKGERLGAVLARDGIQLLLERLRLPA